MKYDFLKRLILPIFFASFSPDGISRYELISLCPSVNKVSEYYLQMWL